MGGWTVDRLTHGSQPKQPNPTIKRHQKLLQFLIFSVKTHRPSCTGMRGPPTHSMATAPAKATMSAKVIWCVWLVGSGRGRCVYVFMWGNGVRDLSRSMVSERVCVGGVGHPFSFHSVYTFRYTTHDTQYWAAPQHPLKHSRTSLVACTSCLILISVVSAGFSPARPLASSRSDQMSDTHDRSSYHTP